MRWASLSLPAAVAAFLAGERDLAGYTWNDYVQEFGKTYNGDEEAARFNAFLANLDAIRKHNSDQSKTWFMTVNEFTDLTPEEFKAMRTGALPLADNSHFVGTFESTGILEDLPASKDWRDEDGVVTPVKDQGACGSCWAFSAVQTLESHLAITTGEMSPILSPQQIVSCSPNPEHCGGTGGCFGSIQPLAFNYTMTAGITTESDYPYRGIISVLSGCQEKKIKPCAQNDGYIKVEVNSYAAHMEAVATKGPIAISLAAGSLQSYGGGILNKCDCDMDHAVQLVGYGTDGGTDYWLVRNSWGQSFGEKGYVRIQRFGEGQEPTCVDKTPQDGEACAGDKTPRTYAGLCGLLGSSSYPTGLRKVGDCGASEALV